MSMFENARARVQSQEGQGDPIDSIFGVLQGGILSPKLFNEFMYDLPQYLDKASGITMDNLQLTHLSYADDIVLIADSPEGLQSNINALHKFCCDWHLIVNTSKTKVMIFGRGDDSVFTYNGSEIDNVDTYKYLGHVISNKTNIHQDMTEYLTTQANKAIFALKADARQNLGYIPPQLAIRMFDTYVLPILEYSSEIWCKVKPISDIEAIQLRYLKTVLGVRKQTPSLAIYAETGRFPLHIRQKFNCVKYWARLETMPQGNILRECLMIQKQLHSRGKPSWYSKIAHVFEESEMTDVPENADLATYDNTLKRLKLKLYEDQMRHILGGINDSVQNPKLRTYKLFKVDYRLEPYLTMDISNKVMKNIARFRTSSHSLRIETGRHERPVVPAENRVCQKCNQNEVEDEIHYLLICPAHSTQRVILTDKIEQVIQNFSRYSSLEKFRKVLTSKESEIIKALGNYITSTI